MTARKPIGFSKSYGSNDYVISDKACLGKDLNNKFNNLITFIYS